MQNKDQFPAKQALHKHLDDDYKELNSFRMKLDVEIGVFTGHMKQIKTNVSDFEGLKILWDEQVKTINHEANEFQIDPDPDSSRVQNEA
jgi:hypothetical protein